MWKRTLFAPAGMNSSLKKSLRMSAKGWKQPERPDPVRAGARLDVARDLALDEDQVGDDAEHDAPG